MPPKKNAAAKKVGEKKTRKKSRPDYFISVVLDVTHDALHTALRGNSSFLSPQQALAQARQQQVAAGSNHNSQTESVVSNTSTTLSDGGKGAASGMYLVKEDTGFECSCVFVVATGRPYLGRAVHQQQPRTAPATQQVCVVASVLPVDQARHLYANGALSDFLRDGLGVAANKYTRLGATAAGISNNSLDILANPSSDDDDDDDDDTDEDDNEDEADETENNDEEDGSTAAGGKRGGKKEQTNLYPKSFLLVEAKPTQRRADDYRYLADLSVLQRSTGVAHVAMTSNNNPTLDSANYVLALANYFSRKCGGKDGPIAQLRDRDDTLKILEPAFMEKGKGKIDTVNYLEAYRAFLCEIDGVTPKAAVNIVARFPTLRRLLDAIQSQDQNALEVLAQTKGDNGRAVGRGLVQRIIDRLSTPFDERRVLQSTARHFYEEKCATELVDQKAAAAAVKPKRRARAGEE